MIITNTDSIEGSRIVEYRGIVSGEAILGANIFKDMFASIRDIVGGRAAGYEKDLKKAKEIAVQEMIDEALALGADAVVGVDLDYEVLGAQNSMLMVGANGTAVRLKSST